VTRPLVAALAALALLPGTGVAQNTTVSVDPSSPGRTFDAVGALSAGASSRMLRDYPEPARSRILDLLFLPGAGASLQDLKVEIGGDSNSTDGAEPSHERVRGEVDCTRGYEWWLMREAKARNPELKLGALAWSFPGWVTPWTASHVDYVVSWLRCAREHGLEIDHVGGWNERPFVGSYYKDLRKALDALGFGDVKLVADDFYFWSVTTGMRADPEAAAAVDIVGNHYPCGLGYSASIDCSTPEDARKLDKPLWASEQWWNNFGTREGAGLLARQINQAYVDGRMTATIIWPLLAAMDESLPNPDTGLVAASRPWSGHFRTGASLHAMGHTGRWTRSGWRYVDTASRKLEGGGTVATMRDPGGDDWSAIIETDQAKAPQALRLEVGPGLGRDLKLWSTDLTSRDERDWTRMEAPPKPSAAGVVTLTLQPGRVYTLTTLEGGGQTRAQAPADRRWALPHAEGFEESPLGHSPFGFSDIEGAWEVVPCGGREGRCLRQQIDTHPVPWFAPPAPWVTRPRTVFGDPQWWGDYEVSVDVSFEDRSVVELGGRLGRQVINNFEIPGYWVRFAATGSWKLLRQDWTGALVPLAAGQAAPSPAVLTDGAWRRLGLRMEGERLDVLVDGERVGGATDPTFRVGQAGLGALTLTNVQVDDLSITPTADAPAWVVPGGPAAAGDDNRGTLWEGAPGAALTLDLGRVRETSGLLVEPHAAQDPTGVITRWRVQVSEDGQTFTDVASGSWPVDLSAKGVAWEPRAARYVRLVAAEGTGGRVAVSETRVGVTR
jgi:O-glycosyl hydrolase